LKKRTIIRAVLFIALILLGISLYTIGKQYTILIDNRDMVADDITYIADATYKVWFDEKEAGVVEKGERIVKKVTGKNHKIMIEKIQDKVATGEKYEKIFKLQLTSNESFLINIPAMINNVDME